MKQSDFLIAKMVCVCVCVYVCLCFALSIMKLVSAERDDCIALDQP